jgi:hypothetical protein
MSRDPNLGEIAVVMGHRGGRRGSSFKQEGLKGQTPDGGVCQN